MAGRSVPFGSIAYYHHSFHRDKPDHSKNMSGRRSKKIVESKNKLKERYEKKAKPKSRPTDIAAMDYLPRIEGHMQEAPNPGSGFQVAPIQDRSAILQALIAEQVVASARRLAAAKQESDDAARKRLLSLFAQTNRNSYPSSFSTDAASRVQQAKSLLLSLQGFHVGPTVLGDASGLNALVSRESTEHHRASTNAVNPSIAASVWLAQQIRSNGLSVDVSTTTPGQQIGARPEQMPWTEEGPVSRFLALTRTGAGSTEISGVSPLMSVPLSQLAAAATPAVHTGTNSDTGTRLLGVCNSNPQLLSLYIREHQRQLSRQLQNGNPLLGLFSSHE